MHEARPDPGVFLLLLALGCGNPQPPPPDTAPAGAPTPSAATTAAPTILFFGDSITAGYQLNPASAFPALIDAKLDSARFPANVVNAGNSGETSAGGLRRISWFMDNPVDIFFLELGANDGLRGVPIPQVRANLQAIIDTVRAHNPHARILIAGMQIPPNMGQSYTADFRELFPTLARRNDATLIPFLLADVAGNPALNLPDRIHPNAEGHRIIAETVWPHLEPLVRDLTAE